DVGDAGDQRTPADGLTTQAHEAARLTTGEVRQRPAADQRHVVRSQQGRVAVEGTVAADGAGRVEPARVDRELGVQPRELVLTDLVERDRVRMPVRDDAR